MGVSQRNNKGRFMSPIILFGFLSILGLLVAGYLMSRMPGQSHSGPSPKPSADDRYLSGRLQRHVDMLAVTIGERNVWKYDNLLRAADYIEGEFLAAGLEVRSIKYEASGKRVRNIEAEITGTGTVQEIIVLGAHYDSLVGTVGANDNASGVAVLLELARLCSGLSYNKTIRFVAFVNEEPPYFKSPSMGSRVYAEQAKRRGERIRGMISLETIGYFTDEPLTQSFPLPLLRYFYPKEGNFLAFVGNIEYRNLLKRSLAAFRKHAEIPSEGVIAPGWLVGVDWSDHWSFWTSGYPALMVTDTALFRYPHYHMTNDTPEKLNYTAMTRVASGLQEVVKVLGQ